MIVAVATLPATFFAYAQPNAWHMPNTIANVAVRFLLAWCLILALSAAISLIPPIWLRILALISIVTTLAIAAFANFTHVWLFEFPITAGAIEAIFASPGNEIIEFWSELSPSFYAIAGIYFLFIAGLTFRLMKTVAHGYHSIRHAIGSIAAAFASLACCIIITNATWDGQRPNTQKLLRSTLIFDINVRFIAAVARYQRDSAALRSVLETRQYITVDAKRSDKASNLVVLVLGESARKSNLGIYGYRLKTTPLLSGRRDEILLIDNAISPAVSTQDSLIRILTSSNSNNENDWAKAISILNVAMSAGYKTYWLSNQGAVGSFDTKTSVLASEANIVKFFNTSFQTRSYDEKLIPALRSVAATEAEHLFVIIHLLGSHSNYYRRYPESRRVFTRKDYTGEQFHEMTDDQKDKIANYDNSIAYTDFVLNEFIQLLQSTNRRSSLVYVSDHGQVLPGEGSSSRFGHADPNIQPNHVQVPLLIWRSGLNEWSAGSPIHSVSPKSSRAYSAAGVFNILVSLLNIDTSVYRESEDLLSSSFAPSEPIIIGPDKSRKAYSDVIWGYE